jgi:spermidine synthase
MSLKRLTIWSIIGTGITSVTTQLITIREFLSQFHGNEITISLVLFCWLLLTGLGSLAAKGVRRPSTKLYTILILIIGVWPLLQLLLIRECREIFFTHGASPGFYPIFFYILFIIAPYCFLVGFVLPYALQVLQEARYDFTSGELYLTDSMGDISGGILFSFVLVYWLKPFPTIAVTSSLLIAVGLLFLIRYKRFALLALSGAIVLLFVYYAVNPVFERETLRSQYGQIVRYLESPYGRIVVTREGKQHTFWESGVPFYSGADVIRSEEKVHYALCQLERAAHVLLVSGGLGLTLAEVAKYHPKRVDYVELDPHLTDVALALGALKKAPYLEVINMDGRHHIKTTKRRYDAVIIDLPDPDTFQINRFFTSEFFSLVKSVLKEGGVMASGMKYSPNYVSDIRRRKLSSLYRTASLHFKTILLLPGEEAYFLCRDGNLSPDIPARLKEKSIRTAYLEGFFYGNATRERIAQLNRIADADEYINTDFEPRLMNIVFQEWFMKHGTSPGYFVAIWIGLTVLYILFMRREEYVLFSTGLVTMGAEMLVIFAFQVIYGYIYLKVGAIVTAFLVGLLPGAIVGNLWGRGGAEKLFLTEGLLLLFLLLFYGWVAYLRTELHPTWFLIYCVCFSFLCGCQFPIAASIIGERNSPAAGLLAADMYGASVGTLATGTLLIPLFGIQFAVIFLILMKVSSSLVILLRGGART